eukprot:SAG22_NODE_97_length_20760_cov_43.302850_12_plen_166_part_00
MPARSLRSRELKLPAFRNAAGHDGDDDVFDDDGGGDGDGGYRVLVLASEFPFGSRQARDHVREWRNALVEVVEANVAMERKLARKRAATNIASFLNTKIESAKQEAAAEDKVFFHEYYLAMFTARLDEQNAGHEAEWAAVAARRAKAQQGSLWHRFAMWHTASKD